LRALLDEATKGLEERSDEELLDEYERELERLRKIRDQLERRGRSKQAEQRQQRVRKRMRPTGTLVVDIADPSGRPIVAVVLHLTGPSDQRISGLTDDEGQAVFDDLEPGTWTLIADAEDLEAQEAQAAIEARRITRLRMVMDFPPEEVPPKPTKEAPSPWLRGSAIYIDYVDPEGAFMALVDVWTTARVGMSADDTGRLKHMPRAYAQGSPIDPGMRIPGYALKDENTFIEWAKSNGYGDGLSVTVDGMVAAPGHSVIKRATPSED
jgi:hypothetical protein